MKKSAIITLFILLIASQALAGTLSPALEARMNDLQGQDVIKVLVIMQGQSDIRSLDKSLRDNRVSLAECHTAVVSTLQDAARTAQQGLLDTLAGDKSAGGIVGYTPHWIINAVVVKGTVAAIRDLATRPDIKFSLPRSAKVNLRVYDVGGRLVRTLLSGELAAGTHSERWDGRDEAGLNVASGVYFARLQFDCTTSIKSMALVR